MQLIHSRLLVKNSPIKCLYFSGPLFPKFLFPCHIDSRNRGQISSVTQLHLTLCDPMNCSMPGFSVHHQILELAQIHVYWDGNASPTSSFVPSLPALNLSQRQSHFQWAGFLHQVAKVKELQLQHQSFQGIFRVDFLYNWLVCSSWGLRDSQESSPTPQFKSIDSSVLSLLCSPTHIHTWLQEKS